MGVSWTDEPRRRRRTDHSLGEVRLLFPRNINPNHPSLYDADPPAPVAMFDQDDLDEPAADRCVLLTAVEARLIAGILAHARSHVPSPKACDEAIDLLTLAGHRPV